MNKTIVIGNLTADPRMNCVDGKDVANFSVAVNSRVQGQEETEYYEVALWGLQATLASSLRKGSKVLLEGRVKVSTYQGNNGETRVKQAFRNPYLEFLSPKPAANGDGI